MKRPAGLKKRRLSHREKKQIRELTPIVFARDERCVYCCGPREVVDHVVPLSRGGTCELDNLVAACSNCNSIKGWRLLEELGWSVLPIAKIVERF